MTLHLVRPNLGKPLMMLPGGLKNFQITIAGTSSDIPSRSEVTASLNQARPILMRQSKDPEGSVLSARLNIIRVHQAYHKYREFKGSWTDGVLPVSAEDHQYAAGYRWEYRVSVGVDESVIDRLKGTEGWPTLLDLKFGKKTNYRAIYVIDKWPSSGNFTLLHITDLHVARRNDLIPEVISVGRDRFYRHELLRRYNNFNDNLRAVIRYANEKAEDGELVVIVATGDLVDYCHDGLFAWSKGKAKPSTSNFRKLVEILTGRDDKCEPLRCPIFTILGNHDYLMHEPPLAFDAEAVFKLVKLYERHSFSKFGLRHSEANLYDHQSKNPDPSVDFADDWDLDLTEDEAYWLIRPRFEHLKWYLQDINYDTDFTFEIGPHQFVCLNTREDICPTKEEMFQHRLIGHVGSAKADFIAGHPHNRGISREHLAMLKDALQTRKAGGLVFCFTHAPLLSLPRDETKGMEVLFEDAHKCERPSKPSNAVVDWFVKFGNVPAGLLADYLKENGYSLGGTRYFKKGERDQLMDSSCAEGEVTEFFHLIAPGGDVLRTLNVLFSGHTHAVHEFRIRSSRGTDNFSFFTDDYSGKSLPDVSADDRKIWLRKHEPLLVTSGGLKKRVPELREVVVVDGAIDSFGMKELPRFDPVPLGGIEYFCAVALATLKIDPDICRLVSSAKWHKSRRRVMAELANRFRGFYEPYAHPHLRPILAARYQDITLFLNSFGVDFGGPGRNSMDPAVHFGWAHSASMQQLCDETAIRIECIFDFAYPGGATGNHLLCMWFARDSTYLGKLGGYTIPDRNSQDPLLHMRWALGVVWVEVVEDIKEKYRLQFDRLAQERDRTKFYDFCAESSARLASWGAECTSTSSPSLDPEHYHSVYYALGDDEARWKLLEGQLERLWTTLATAGSGYM